MPLAEAWSRFVQTPWPEAAALSRTDLAVNIGLTVPLAWRANYVAAAFETPSAELLAALREKGFEIVVLGLDASAWVESVPKLARLLGRPA